MSSINVSPGRLGSRLGRRFAPGRGPGLECLEPRLALAASAALESVGDEGLALAAALAEGAPCELSAPVRPAAAAVAVAEGLTVTTTSVSVASNPSAKVQGFVDVFIDTPVNGTFAASGYEVSLRFQGDPAGIRFIGAQMAAAPHAPVFPGQNPSVLGVGASLKVTDFLVSGDTPIADGAGLFRANFEVDAGVTGVFPLIFEGGFTNVSDRQGQPLQIDALTGGAVTVTGIGGPSISVADVQVSEGNAGTVDAVFTVTLSEASATSVAVDFATQPDDATAGVDYVTTTGRLTFAPGVTSLTVPVPVNGDTEDEANETFRLVLSNPSGGTLGTATGAATILDDDGAGANPWKNPLDPFDINDDGDVLPLDALLVINALNDGGSRPLLVPPVPPEAPPPFLDPSGDDFLSPLDALLVINEINAQAAAQALGPALAAASPPSTGASGLAPAADLAWQAACDWHLAALASSQREQTD